MSDRPSRPSLASGIIYDDPWAALDWLEKAFGFERVMVITAEDGSLAHSEMRFGNSLLFVGGAYADFTTSPASIENRNTQFLHVQLTESIDAHFDKAVAAGAAVEQDPADQFYGDRTYRVRDPEGHRWSFGQTLHAVTREAAEQASGLKIEGWV